MPSSSGGFSGKGTGGKTAKGKNKGKQGQGKGKNKGETQVDKPEKTMEQRAKAASCLDI